MDPMQQQPAPPNPYGFIVNPEQPPKRPLLGGNSVKSRALVFGGGILLLIIIAVIVMSIFSSIGSAGTNQLKTVYAEQQELIRIAELGANNALSTDTRGFAATTLLSTRTSQQQVQSILSSRRVKLTPEEINAKQNPNVEEILTGASANNRYDETMVELLNERITNYNQALRAAYDSNDGQQTRNTLNEAFASASTLVNTTE